MFIPWWGIALIVIILAYLIGIDLRLHRRVERLERIVRKLEGVTEEDVKREIQEKMMKSLDGGN